MIENRKINVLETKYVCFGTATLSGGEAQIIMQK
jgi:hypothetical protein